MRTQVKQSTITATKAIAVDSDTLQVYPVISFFVKEEHIASFYKDGETYLMIHPALKVTQPLEYKTIEVAYEYTERDLIRAFVDLEECARDFDNVEGK